MLGRMHRPNDEKRRPEVVPPTEFGRWLNASTDEALALLHRNEDDGLTGSPAARLGRPAPAPPQQSLDL
jgi:hypothetical protein